MLKKKILFILPLIFITILLSVLIYNHNINDSKERVGEKMNETTVLLGSRALEDFSCEELEFYMEYGALDKIGNFRFGEKKVTYFYDYITDTYWKKESLLFYKKTVWISEYGNRCLNISEEEK